MLVHDLDTQTHYVEFKEIVSDRYITLTVDDLMLNDPQEIIQYLEKLRLETGAEYVKIKVRSNISGQNKTIINQYYRNNKHMFVEFQNADLITQSETQTGTTDNGYNYLLDDKISDLERFVMFVNEKEGEQFITVDKLKEILNSDI